MTISTKERSVLTQVELNPLLIDLKHSINNKFFYWTSVRRWHHFFEFYGQNNTIIHQPKLECELLYTKIIQNSHHECKISGKKRERGRAGLINYKCVRYLPIVHLWSISITMWDESKQIHCPNKIRNYRNQYQIDILHFLECAYYLHIMCTYECLNTDKWMRN